MAHWKTILQGYGLKIKPIKSVREQGLCKLIVEARDALKDEYRWENEAIMKESEIYYIPFPIYSCYYELNHYLTHGNAPTYLESQNREL